MLVDEVRSTPGRKPVPLNVFKGRAVAERADFGRATREVRNASSITSPMEQFHSHPIAGKENGLA
jgi:hypothetical protein